MDDAPLLPVGATVAQRYRVERWLARGGFAEVYVVVHVLLETTHALKVLRSATPTLRARLVDEGRIQARLRHPHIVRVTDVVDLVDHGGGLGLVMDLVDGPTLADHLATGRLSLPDAWRLGTQILEGVAAAHALGLVHRDLKPDNVLLETLADGSLRPRITDFGLARARHADAGPRHTRAGMGLGTPAYMAPEQFQDASSVDQRADVFSLGAILFELVTGRRAFDGTSPAALFRQVATADRPMVDTLAPHLPAGMVEAIESALEPDRTIRAESCAHLLMMWTLDTPDGVDAPPPQPVVAPSAPAHHPATDTYVDVWQAEPPEPPPPEPPPAPPPPPPAPAATEPAAARHSWAAPAAVLALPALVALLQVSAPFDVWAHAWLLRVVDGPLPSTLTAVLPLSVEGDLRAFRQQYPALLHALADAGAASVTFDLAFSAADPADADFATAVQALADRGIPVFAAGRWRDGQLEGPGTPELASVLHTGVAVLETEGWQQLQLGRVPAHVWSAGTARDEWALSVLTVQSWAPRLAGPAFDDRAGQLTVAGRTILAPDGRFSLHPVTPPPELSLDAPDRWPDIHGRAVIVGVLDDHDRFLTRTGVAHGLYLQAAAVETLAAGRSPMPAGRLENVLLALVAAVGGFALGRRSRVAAVGLAAGAVALAIGVVRIGSGVLPAVGPVLVGAAVAWWAARRWPARPVTP